MSEATVLMMRPDGPNVVTGDVVIVTPARVREMKTAVLCRCGHSSDQPFCDGTHVKIGFTEPARLPTDARKGYGGRRQGDDHAAAERAEPV